MVEVSEKFSLHPSVPKATVLSVKFMLQQIAGQFGQITSFALEQVDVGKDILSFHPVGQIGKSVGLHIQIGGVDLLNIPCKDHFSTLAGACDDGFYLMRRKILSLVDDK